MLTFPPFILRASNHHSYARRNLITIMDSDDYDARSDQRAQSRRRLRLYRNRHRQQLQPEDENEYEEEQQAHPLQAHPQNAPLGLLPAVGAAPLIAPGAAAAGVAPPPDQQLVQPPPAAPPAPAAIVAGLPGIGPGAPPGLQQAQQPPLGNPPVDEQLLVDDITDPDTPWHIDLIQRLERRGQAHLPWSSLFNQAVQPQQLHPLLMQVKVLPY